MTDTHSAKALNVLELFSGTHSISDAFRSRGHVAHTVDWDPSVDADLHADIGSLTLDGIVALCGGVPDVVWASPDCTTFSVAAISHHRVRDPDTGLLLPRTPYAEQCDRIDAHVVDLIRGLARLKEEEGGSLAYFVENPRGGMRRAPFIADLPGAVRYTVTFCQYGESRMKPTDIWSNVADAGFRPPCKAGAPCHERAPRGSRAGTQGIKGSLARAHLPEQLCGHVVDICEARFAGVA